MYECTVVMPAEKDQEEVSLNKTIAINNNADFDKCELNFNFSCTCPFLSPTVPVIQLLLSFYNSYFL